jgi:hypothetical protein
MTIRHAIKKDAAYKLKKCDHLSSAGMGIPKNRLPEPAAACFPSMVSLLFSLKWIPFMGGISIGKSGIVCQLKS